MLLEMYRKTTSAILLDLRAIQLHMQPLFPMLLPLLPASDFPFRSASISRGGRFSVSGFARGGRFAVLECIRFVRSDRFSVSDAFLSRAISSRGNLLFQIAAIAFRANFLNSKNATILVCGNFRFSNCSSFHRRNFRSSNSSELLPR